MHFRRCLQWRERLSTEPTSINGGSNGRFVGVPCGFIASAPQARFTAAGGTGSITVTRTEGSNCAWTATSPPASFLTITSGTSGSDSGTVSFAVSENADAAERTASVTVAGQVVTITQDGRATPCQFSVSPTTFTFGPEATTAQVSVTVSHPNCAWTATSTASFITITSGTSGSDSGVVALAVAANSGATRTGALTVAGQAITVTQGLSTVNGTFQGAVSSSPTVVFGGPPYCNYSAVLTDISSSIDFANGQITRAVVSNTASEAALQGCPFPVGPPNQQSYSMRSSSVNGLNVTIDYVATAGNYPHATLHFAGQLSNDSRSLFGTLTWQRDDQPTAPNLDWRIAADITHNAR